MEFTLDCQLPASPLSVYNAWLSSEGHTEMTGGEASASDQDGAEFYAWDQYIWGKNIELEPGCRIVQSWRTTEFAESDPDSEIEILLSEHDGGTHLVLTHRNLQEDATQYIQGWQDHYFNPMLRYFSK